MSLTVFLILSLLALSGGLLFIREPGLLRQLTPRQTLKQNMYIKTKPPAQRALLELPEFVSLLWFMIVSGESLHSSLKETVALCDGYLSSEFEKILQRIEHGSILELELERVATETKSDELRELATKLAVSLANGTPLADQLAELVASANSSLRSTLIERAGKNETKMMIPLIFIILPITVMFALYPSVTLLRNSFI